MLEEVSDLGEVDNGMYLPQREVLRDDKPFTKLTVVFDASAKSSGEVGLNDDLYRGLCLTPFVRYTVAISNFFG